MKKKSLVHQFIFTVLIAASLLQSVSLSAITVTDLKEYHASFVRGAQCFFGRKKCSEQDQRAWRRGSAGIVLALLAIASYTQRGRIASLFAGRSKIDITEYALDISMDTNNLIIGAIQAADVDALKGLAENPKNLNVVYFDKSLLWEAIVQAMLKPHDKNRIAIIKILLKNNGRKYDYDQSAQKYLDKLNQESKQNRPLDQEKLKVLEEINKLWNSSSQ